MVIKPYNPNLVEGEMLREKIDSNLIEAVKQRANLKMDTLRFIKAALHNAEIEKGKKELTDEEIILVLKKLSKKHQESIEAFKKGNRLDLVKKEEEELAIVKSYLPEELSQDEIIKMIQKAIEETGAQSQNELGKVMKKVMAEAKGRLDGKLANLLVQKELEKLTKP